MGHLSFKCTRPYEYKMHLGGRGRFRRREKFSPPSPQLLLLVFSVTPFRIDQNKNQIRSRDKGQNLGKERRQIRKYPGQDSGQRNISYTRYLKKCFTQIYTDLRRHAGAHPDGHQNGERKRTETSVTEFCYKSVNLFFDELINIKVILFLIHELFR